MLPFLAAGLGTVIGVARTLARFFHRHAQRNLLD
jgi:hypothetical protein